MKTAGSLLMLFLFLPAPCHALMAAEQVAVQPESSMRQDLRAIQTFNKLHEDETGVLQVQARRKHQILFLMGAGLLTGLLTTAGLGLAMVLGGKQVFVWHMLSAGITLTLAIAHAVTAIIWFFPF